MILKTFSKFKDRDYLIVVPSTQRAEKYYKRTGQMFPFDTVLFVNKAEAKDYEKYNPEVPIVTHSQTEGYGSVVNALIRQARKDHIKYVVIIDDDKEIFDCMVGNRQRAVPLMQRYEVLTNAVQVMEDLEAPLYLFSTSSSIIKYQQHKPYTASFALPQGAYIVNVKTIGITFEEGYQYYEDFDFCMEAILKHRFYLCEQRMLILSREKAETISGGCNAYRTSANEIKSRQWVKKKWGKAMTFTKNSSGNIRPTCLVSRNG